MNSLCYFLGATITPVYKAQRIAKKIKQYIYTLKFFSYTAIASTVN